MRDKEVKIIGIINVTMSLVGAKGYNDVTTRDIARAASVSNGLVFKYFPGGKPEIVKVFVGTILKIKPYAIVPWRPGGEIVASCYLVRGKPQPYKPGNIEATSLLPTNSTRNII